MSGMVLQYNSPEIYILGSTNKIQELNMDGLFVSPAGRELMKQKSQYHHKTKIKHSNEFSKTLPTLSFLTETSSDIKKDKNVIPTTKTKHINEDNFKKNSLDIVPITTTTIADSIESTSSTASASSYYSTPSSTSCSHSMKINNNNTNDNDTNQDSCSLQSQSIKQHAKNIISTVEENEKKCDEKNLDSECNRTSESYYEEELELLLGINCVLEDDCRCFECQSSYFDYTEDDDFDENLENIKNPNSSPTPTTNTGIPCRRHHTNHATNMYCCIQ